MDQRFDATANLSDLVDDPTALDRLFEEADRKSEERLWSDPEWSEQRWVHRKDIVRAFLVGVIDADAWFSGYSVPPNLEIVANVLCGAISVKFAGKDELVKASLLDLEALYREFIDATPFVREWNDYPGSGIVSRFSATPSERTFIDLGALTRNAAIHIRNDRREFDRFNAEFDARNGSIQDTNKRRVEQDGRWGGLDHDDHHDELDWQSFIEKQVKDAANADSSDQWRDRMVDIGALALAAIEWADRRTKEQQ